MVPPFYKVLSIGFFVLGFSPPACTVLVKIHKFNNRRIKHFLTTQILNQRDVCPDHLQTFSSRSSQCINMVSCSIPYSPGEIHFCSTGKGNGSVSQSSVFIIMRFFDIAHDTICPILFFCHCVPSLKNNTKISYKLSDKQAQIKTEPILCMVTSIGLNY